MIYRFTMQSTLFMLAGFDTTATTLTNTCFQLARNPDIQEKLYESIVSKMEDYVNPGYFLIHKIFFKE